MHGGPIPPTEKPLNDQPRKPKETGYDRRLICNHLEVVFLLRSHSVCQLTIERTLNKNKIVTEASSKHGESCLNINL